MFEDFPKITETKERETVTNLLKLVSDGLLILILPTEIIPEISTECLRTDFASGVNSVKYNDPFFHII